jgi:hypothetical protein
MEGRGDGEGEAPKRNVPCDSSEYLNKIILTVKNCLIYYTAE